MHFTLTFKFFIKEDFFILQSLPFMYILYVC